MNFIDYLFKLNLQSKLDGKIQHKQYLLPTTFSLSINIQIYPENFHKNSSKFNYINLLLISIKQSKSKLVSFRFPRNLDSHINNFLQLSVIKIQSRIYERMTGISKVIMITLLIYTLCVQVQGWQDTEMAKTLQLFIDYRNTFFRSKAEIQAMLLPLFSVGGGQLLHRYVYKHKQYVDYLIKRRRSPTECMIIQLQKSSKIQNVVAEAERHAQNLQNLQICTSWCAIGINIPYDWSYSPIQLQGYGSHRNMGCKMYEDIRETLVQMKSYNDLILFLTIVIWEQDPTAY